MKKRLMAFKRRLTSVSKEEPLNKLSLATIIILDLFILTILFIGLHEHTDQLTKATEYMPRVAQEIFIHQDWTPANRISKLQPLILSDRNNRRYRYNSPFKEQRIQCMHPASRDVYRQAHALSKDLTLHPLFLERQKSVQEKRKTKTAFNKAKKSYDTQLLENIANASKPGTNATSSTAQEYAKKINRLTWNIRSLEQQINDHSGIQKLWETTTPSDAARKKIVSDYKRFQFWFPLKELAWQLLFMLPIFGIFYAWSTRSVKKDNPIQALIASHLLVITFLPILLKSIELVIDIIPKHFFKTLFELLQSLHLMALWHYFVIFAAIGIGLFLVYFIQRKVFNKQKVMQKRLSNGACTFCNKKLPVHTEVCPFCGTRQMEPCNRCQEKTPIAGTYCIHCGDKRRE